MNILPKKRWHVRTKDNIARVRRDEAQAAQEEKDRDRRAQLAEQEARTSFLRQQASDRQALPAASLDDQHDSAALVPLNTPGTLSTIGHVSFISEADKEQKKWGTNKEWEEENKQEKEKFEKSIGLLTYLGQSVLDTKGEQPWYAKRRSVDDQGSSSSCTGGQQDRNDARQSKSKNLLDPLNDMRKYLKMIDPSTGSAVVKSSLPISRRTNPGAVPSGTPDAVRPSMTLPAAIQSASFSREKHSSKKDKRKAKKSKKAKKHKKSSSKRKRSRSSSACSASDSSDSDDQRKLAVLERLRVERIKREQVERTRSEKLVAMSRTGGSDKLATSSSAPPSDGRQKYNSQFNPHLAKKPRLEL